jgi:predicted membrane protein
MTHNHSRKRILIGLIITVIGAMLLLRSFGIYSDFINEYIFRWEMILISIGVVSILSHESFGPGVIMLLIGSAFYARNYVELPNNLSFWQIFLALLFILSGIFMIIKRKSYHECEKKNGKTSDLDSIEEVAIFGGGDRTIVSNNFRGGKIICVFGGSNLFLSRSKLAPGKNYIDVMAVFGGFKLVVPEDWNIKIDTISIFGGFSDKHRINTPAHSTEGEPQLIIKGFVIFGGGEIKSY